MKISLMCSFFDLIVKASEIYMIPEWTQFWHEMLKIASVFINHGQWQMILKGRP